MRSAVLALERKIIFALNKIYTFKQTEGEEKEMKETLSVYCSQI